MAKVELEKEKVFLTEQEQEAIKSVNTKQENLQRKLIELGEVEIMIDTLEDNAYNLKVEIKKLKEDFNTFNLKVSNDLLQKYGKCTLGENWEVINE